MSTTITGEWRSPAQMLDDQSYDGHASVHDADTAASLGLAGAPIEGPTHFSQFDPLAEQLWGRQWFETGPSVRISRRWSSPASGCGRH